MRSLHVAALPFPSPQGTQGALRTMLDACASEVGAEVHLLVYGPGSRAVEDAQFALHRAPVPRVLDRAAGRSEAGRSPRSGPSLLKLACDVALVLELRRVADALRPELVVAHHVEACAAALLAGLRPLVFVAHTALAPELPAYAPRVFAPLLAPFLSRAGGALDAALCRRADAVAAVGPALAARLAASTDVDVHALALPWPLPRPITRDERLAARAWLGLEASDEVVLYAGNLDRYQGLALAFEALGRVAARRPPLRVLIATESAPRELSGAVDAAGLAARVVFARLDTEDARRRAHAAADVALVPRAMAGGVPVKLLDALARGVPVVAQRRAEGGLALSQVATVCADDDAAALAASLLSVLALRHAAGELGQRGRSYIAREHSQARFLATLAGVSAQALDAAGRRRK